MYSSISNRRSTHGRVEERNVYAVMVLVTRKGYEGKHVGVGINNLVLRFMWYSCWSLSRRAALGIVTS